MCFTCGEDMNPILVKGRVDFSDTFSVLQYSVSLFLLGIARLCFPALLAIRCITKC